MISYGISSQDTDLSWAAGWESREREERGRIQEKIYDMIQKEKAFTFWMHLKCEFICMYVYIIDEE